MGRSGKRNSSGGGSSSGGGRRDRNQTERLPKGERREATKRLSLTPSSSTGSFEATFHRSVSVVSLPSMQAPEGDESELPLALRLPDDILRRILRLAGLLAVVNATRVHRRWRRVALELLAFTEYVNVAALFKTIPSSQLSYHSVLQFVRSVPKLKRLSLAGWPTSLALQDIASAVMQQYESHQLREIDLSGLNFEHSDLHALCLHCPYLSVIKLDNCKCVNDALVKQLVRTRRDANRDSGRDNRFAALDISGSSVTHEGIMFALRSKVVDRLVAMRSYKLVMLSAQHVGTEALNLSTSKNLMYACLTVAPGALLSLNASHCKNLTRISIARAAPRPGVPPVGPLPLETLNLHGAAKLYDISFDGASPQNAVEADGESDEATAPRHLPNLQELHLMNARSLGPEFFRERLGLSSIQCPMPKLRRINLNGCLGIDRLCLVSYPNLINVACAGCTTLTHVQIRHTPQLEELDLTGKRVPLTLVDVLIPRKTKVAGIRVQWAHVLTATTQHLTFNE